MSIRKDKFSSWSYARKITVKPRHENFKIFVIGKTPGRESVPEKQQVMVRNCPYRTYFLLLE